MPSVFTGREYSRAMKTLYESDSYEWALQNATLVRQGRVGEADLDHIAEELEALGISQRHALATRIKVLLMHLLKWSLRPELDNKSWRATISVQRRDIARMLRKAPSLAPCVAEEVRDVYPDAAADATDEMLVDASPFPAECPFTVEQILDLNFFPESRS